MRKFPGYRLVLVTFCAFSPAACGGGGGMASAPLAAPVPASLPAPPPATQTTPALTVVVPSNLQAANTIATYPATSAAMSAASVGLAPANAGEGVTALTI